MSLHEPEEQQAHQEEDAERSLLRRHNNNEISQKDNYQITRITFNLISATTGTSTISVPLTLAILGCVPGTIVLILQTSFGIFANHILSKESEKLGGVSYHELMSRRVGSWAGFLASASIIQNGVGKLVVWVILLTDVILGSPPDYNGLLPEYLRHFGHLDEDAWYMSRGAIAAGIAIASFPFISVRSLDKISWVSLVGDVAVLLMTVVSFILSIIAVANTKSCDLPLFPTSPHSAQHEHSSSSDIKFWIAVMAALPMLISSVFNQHSILSVQRQLKPYDQKRLDIATSTAAVFIAVLKLTLAISSLAIFGSKIKSDVLLNYSQRVLVENIGVGSHAALFISLAVKLAFLINGAVSFPLYLWPLQSNLWSSLRGEEQVERTMDYGGTFSRTNIAIMCVSASIAALLSDVKIPLTVLGATVVGYLAFIAPALLVLMPHGDHQWSSGATALASCMLALGAFQAVAGTLSIFV